MEAVSLCLRLVYPRWGQFGLPQRMRPPPLGSGSRIEPLNEDPKVRREYLSYGRVLEQTRILLVQDQLLLIVYLYCIYRIGYLVRTAAFSRHYAN